LTTTPRVNLAALRGVVLIPFVPAGWLGAEGELLDSPEVTHLQPGVVFSLKDDLPAIPPYQADDNEL